MAQLMPELRRAEREFLVGCQRVEELPHVLFVGETTVLHAEELIKVEGILSVLIFGEVKPLLQRIADHVRELIGEHVEAREFLVGVRPLLHGPIYFGLLLVLVGPVVDLLRAELAIGDGLEGRAGQVQRELAPDFIKCLIRLIGVDALMCLVDDQQIPLRFLNPFQLRVVAAKVDRSFQPLQALKGYHASLVNLVIVQGVKVAQVLLMGHHGALLAQ